MQQLLLINKNNNEINDRIIQLEAKNAVLSRMLQEEININQLKAGFLAQVSHELRSPLTNIQLSASPIEHYYHRLDRDKIFGHLNKIKNEVNHFVVVLNNYLLIENSEKADDGSLI
ncbi:histidine kinase dimerization/phospho-acceptor domain-containing protein [Mucilaginibacter terrae]|uniref:histidine kinase dimerization/phospho-acceptor domain-containing protein n=1 Tax=Mucilaginibacter terrae TaxID=1955052 RepID=UPI003634C4D1